jgi:hydrogenase-1 operon protein HyaE
MSSALITRLSEELHYPLVNKGNLPELLAGHEIVVLFFGGDPARYPESNDVAVILPELINAFKGRLTPAVVELDAEPALKERYPFRTWPTLVFLEHGIQKETISKVKDWADYISAIEALLNGQHGNKNASEVIPSVRL